MAIDLHALDGDVHVFRLVDDRENGEAGEGDLGAAHAVADDGAALLDLAEASEDADEAADEDEQEERAGDAEQRLQKGDGDGRGP